MTADISYEDYQEMLVLLDEMHYLVRYDYQVEFPPPDPHELVEAGYDLRDFVF